MINKIILVGRVGKEVETTHLDSGLTVAKFSMATNEVFKDKEGNKKENTEWHQVVLWRKLAEVAEQYVKKGDLLYIEGKVKTRSWEDKDGKKHYSTEVIGDSMQMLGGKKENTQQDTPMPKEENMPENTSKENDLPF
jgi:single-strand DNA-binding protein